MQAGTTFLRADSDDHLWIVLSDPHKDPQNVLLVNMTSAHPRKERACVLNRGDHPWIRHETCINYGDAVVTTLELLFKARNTGALVVQEPLSPSVLTRLWKGAADSTRITIENFDILEDQGLVDF